ncbi:MAG: glycosyl transferase [Chloroflexi bacterium HGW-Chloroflexi-10]|nr:MAG: glycosyl transferase [Chloroflexi bacterium HGW-Chloroflexi-10]
MKYGYFDHTNHEYVITTPKTPVKWVNYIGTLKFGGIVDHTGGALLCKKDPALNRMTKYITQMPDADFKGETLYLRIHTPKGIQIFSPFFVPTLTPYEQYECHVGLGYSRFISIIAGIRCEITVFVPQNAEIEIRDIRVTNLRKDSVHCDVIPLVEYTHPDALKQLTNADWVPQTMQSSALIEDGLTTLVQYPFMNKETQVNYFTANLSASSFETDRRHFLGDNGYGTFQNPTSLQNPELGNHQANRGDNIAALLIPLGNIRPQETHQVITLFGQSSSLNSAKSQINHYRNPQVVHSAFQQLKEYWKAFLSHLQVNTPDENMNNMLNTFNPYQCAMTANWSRYLSLYQLGYGSSRGIGFRDNAQDIMGVMTNDPIFARQLLARLISTQKRDGSAMHQFNPLSMEASVGDSAEYEDRPHFYSDDHLWMVLAVCAYLKESGDFAFLEEYIPFYDKNKQGKAVECGTVLEHLQRGLNFTREHVGAHQLPLLGFADWNDTINLPTGAESVFTACLYGRALNEISALYDFLEDEKHVELYRAWFAEMQNRVETHAWDGAWYLRYFDADGIPLGSHQNTFSQIFTNAQSWAVISGFAAPGRAKQALNAVNQRLNTAHGIKLSTPGFNGYDREIGGVTTYPPGAKENGGIFLHANPWAMIAEALSGNGERAFQYYNQINPASKNDMLDIYECEPYVYPQNILGDEHPQFGLARNSWLSGTASWTYQAATQYILGIQPDYHGLRINPCIPANWEGFNMERIIRDARYQITVHNPSHVQKGIRRCQVDGLEHTGSVVPYFLDRGTHTIEIWMG